MLPIQENSVIDFEGFASEFGEDEGPLMDLGQGDQTQVEAQAVETPVVEQSEIPEGVERPVVEGEAPAQENAPEAPQSFQFKYNNQDYEVNVDQIVELNNGYLRQEDYTKKLQWWGSWFQQHQNEVGFVQNLNKFFTLKPEKAEFFYRHVLNDEPVQGQPAQTQTPGSEKTVQELLAEPQVQQQQPQQQQISPEVAHLYNVVTHQQQQLKAQQEWREDYQLDQRLNLARQKYGDFDENSVLKWMYHLKTEDPEVAINRMIAEAWTAQARQGAGQQRPQQQQQRPQVQQPAPHIEGGGKGRGVVAAQNGAKQPAQTYPNWSAAQQALLQSGIF